MLTLTIKKKWFDAILSGEKKEEYRDVKPYYSQRFEKRWCARDKFLERIRFRNGYAKNSPSFVAKCSMRIGVGRPEWGADPDKQYYVLTIHEIEKEGGEDLSIE